MDTFEGGCKFTSIGKFYFSCVAICHSHTGIVGIRVKCLHGLIVG